MAEEIINIATLTIDKTEANKGIVETKQAIFDLQKANSELRKDISKNGDITGEQTKKFVENEQQLKKLNAEYKLQSAALNDLTLAELKENKALTEAAKSRGQAIDQNKELKTVRDQLNTTTKEGAAALELINKKIDANDAYLRSNSSALEKQKDNVGNYGMVTENLSRILSEQGGIFATVRTKVEGFKSTVSGSIDTVKSVHASVVGATQGIIGFGNASKAAAVQASTLAAGETVAATATEGLAVAEGTATVASTGLASVLGVLLFPITAIIAAGLILYSVFKDFAPVVNPIKDAFAALGAVFVVLKTAILDLVTGTRSLGDIFSTLSGDIADATVETYKLEGAQRALTKAMDIQELASARTATKVKELILQSKDLSKTVAERTALINKAQALEENEFQNRFKNYKTEKELLIRKLSVGKTVSEEEKQRLREGDYEFLKSIAKKRKLDTELVEAYKKNQLSREQLLQEDNQIQEKAQNYKNKIIEKDQAKQEKAAEAAAKRSEDNAKKEQDRRVKSLAESKLLFESEIHDAEEKLKFYESYYAKLNELEGGSNKVKNARELSSTLLNIAKETIDAELEQQTKKIEADKTLNAQQQADLLANAEFLKAEQTKRIDESILNEVDKAAALAEIQKAYLESVVVINQEFADGEKARAEEAKALAALDFEMKLLVLEDQGLRESDLKRAILTAQYEEEARLRDEALKNEEITQAEATAKKLIADKKYSQATKVIDKELAATKKAAVFGIAQDAIAAAQNVFGESKALAVAAALINTYQGITAELSTKAVTPYEIGLKVANVAIVAANGFAAVRNIMKTDKGSSSGSSSSSRGGSGGTSSPAAIYENPAKTQTVATVNAPPVSDIQPTQQPVLILETLSEAQKNQIVKIKSN